MADTNSLPHPRVSLNAQVTGLSKSQNPAKLVATYAAKEKAMKRYEETHPWIRFKLDVESLGPHFWMLLGEARSKCQHIKGVPLEPVVAERLHRLFLAKGVQATTAIEGNTLSEDQVLDHIEGKDLHLPDSQEYLETEIRNIAHACNVIWNDIESGGSTDLTPEMVCRWNEMVLADLPEEGVVPGAVRTDSVLVGSVYRGAPAEDCEFLISELCTWLNGDTFRTEDTHLKVPYAVLRAIAAHLYLAWIHPFGNGNGRTARLMEVHILSAAGIPKPAAHLLSNHYNQTRTEYYKQLEISSKQVGNERHFISYAVKGFVEGLHSQLRMIRDQQLAVAWENYVHRAFQEEKSEVGRRQRTLVLELSRHEKPIPKSQLRGLSADIAVAYRDRTDRAIDRDVDALVRRGLIARTNKGIRARTETILAFLPGVAPDEQEEAPVVRITREELIEAELPLGVEDLLTDAIKEQRDTA